MKSTRFVGLALLVVAVCLVPKLVAQVPYPTNIVTLTSNANGYLAYTQVLISGDGSKVAFVDETFDATRTARLWLADVSAVGDDGGAPELLATQRGLGSTSHLEGRLLLLGLSHNGSRVLFSRHGNDTNNPSSGLYLMETVSQTTFNILPRRRDARLPDATLTPASWLTGTTALSSDGNWVFFYATSAWDPVVVLAGGTIENPNWAWQYHLNPNAEPAIWRVPAVPSPDEQGTNAVAWTEFGVPALPGYDSSVGSSGLSLRADYAGAAVAFYHGTNDTGAYVSRGGGAQQAVPTPSGTPSLSSAGLAFSPDGGWIGMLLKNPANPFQIGSLSAAAIPVNGQPPVLFAPPYNLMDSRFLGVSGISSNGMRLLVTAQTGSDGTASQWMYFREYGVGIRMLNVRASFWSGVHNIGAISHSGREAAFQRQLINNVPGQVWARRFIEPLIVNTTDDLDDGECDETHGSLREAIQGAQRTGDMDFIGFKVPGNNRPVISPGTELPVLAGPVVLQGVTLGRTDPADRAIIDGAGRALNGLVVSGADVAIHGLGVVRAGRNGMHITSGAELLIDNCWLGLDSTGAANLGNGLAGIYAQSDKTTFRSNVISGNLGHGLQVYGRFPRIVNNLIGVGMDGRSALGNGTNGIVVEGSFSFPEVFDNVIGGNGGHGIYVTTRGPRISGNRIGVNADDSALAPNRGDGVHLRYVDAAEIGATWASGPNVIVGNYGHGIAINGGSSGENYLQGNRIGTDATGRNDWGNHSNGVWVSSAPKLVLRPYNSNPQAEIIHGNLRHGLEITNAVLLATNVVVRNNAGDGIRFHHATATNVLGGTNNLVLGNGGSGVAGSGWLDITTIRAQANQGWGLDVRGRLDLNSPPPDSALGPLSEILTNTLGGIRVGRGTDGSGGLLSARKVDVLGNGGPGLAAVRDISLRLFRSNGNGGPGVQSLFGNVSVEGAVGASEVNEASYNLGPGMLAGCDLAFPAAGGGGTANQKIEANTAVSAEGNASWGIYAPEGNVSLNRLEGFSSPASPNYCNVRSNGFNSTGIRYLGYDGNLVALPPGRPDGGGIGAGLGYIVARRVRASDNNGPGMVARMEVELTTFEASGNQRGPGVQSLLGSITVLFRSDEDVNLVANNAGPGLLAGTDLLIPHPGRGSGLLSAAIQLKTSVQVVSNSSWGIFAEQGPVIINDISTGASPSQQTSCVYGNGFPLRPIFIVDGRGVIQQIPHRLADSGGVGAGRGYLIAQRIDASGNNGPGLLARGDIEIVPLLRANHNQRGPGLQSLLGKIHIAHRTGQEANEVSGNYGPGILAGTEIDFWLDSQGGLGTGTVQCDTAIQVLSNASWGIFANEGSITINDIPPGLPITQFTSRIAGNGNRSLPLYLVNTAGDIEQIRTVLPNAAGGLGANRGSILGRKLDVVDNLGVGLAATHGLSVFTGTVCGNSAGETLTAGARTLSADVTLCDTDRDNVSAAVEALAPNNGDGNRDGVPDSVQPSVASVPLASSQYATLAAPSGCELASVATWKPHVAQSPPDAELPLGVLGLSVVKVTATNAVTVVELFLPEAAASSNLTFRRYGPLPGAPTNQWYEFNYDGTTGAQFLSDRILLHLVDGGRGDDDLAANGVIVIGMGGPAAPATARPAPTLAQPVMRPGGAFEWQFLGQAQVPYRIEISADLVNWHPLTELTGSEVPQTILDPEAAGSRQLYYRAVEQ